jgi:TolA-binding protein
MSATLATLGLRRFRLPRASVWAAVLTVTISSGCMTTMQGRKVRMELADVRARLDDIDKLDRDHKEQVVELRRVLDQATALLTANTNDVGAKEARAETGLSVLQEEVARLGQALDRQSRRAAEDESHFEARVAALERSEARIADKIAPLLPDDKEQLWKQSAERLTSGERDEGRRFYRAFIQRFPQDPRTSQAYLAIGLSYVQEKRFPNAVAELQGLLDKYPSSPEVPEAMWQLSQAFEQMKFCRDARSLLRDLVRRYPKSPVVGDAQKELKAVQRRAKATCTS